MNITTKKESKEFREALSAAEERVLGTAVRNHDMFAGTTDQPRIKHRTLDCLRDFDERRITNILCIINIAPSTHAPRDGYRALAVTISLANCGVNGANKSRVGILYAKRSARCR
jgi:hypothetical protein